MLFFSIHLIKFAGNAIALCLFLSPTPTFRRIVKKKSVEEYSPIPYLATLINCLVWVLYGLPMVHPDSTLVVTINGAGILIEVVFITIFFVFSGRPKQRLVIAAVLAGETLFVAILAVLVFTLQHTTTERTMSVGIVCCVFNVMMYASPLSVMIPNGIGCIFGLAQLILYAAYYKSTKKMMAERQPMIGLSSAVVRIGSEKVAQPSA
ncbi:hypothetical protein F2Q70_00003362 [Brassica cretica]|uniref:Bidirectional sugar transporter SWEET n=1 Tax=Brassica cretica TaxID=69181 RepID=A0A8S9ITT9_BRACR|nr:hypothetical protein F2Q70_00003362 [Brassica cretica]